MYWCSDVLGAMTECTVGSKNLAHIFQLLGPAGIHAFVRSAHARSVNIAPPFLLSWLPHNPRDVF